jgi:elongation factor 1-alpha
VSGKVESILRFPDEIETAEAGDVIGIKADCEPRRGDVGGYPAQPPVPVDEFPGEVVLLEGTLKEGDEFEIKCGTMKSKCTVKEIKQKISSETGEVLGKSTGEIGKNDAAELVFRTEPMVVEPFSEIPELGRFILAKEMKNVGAGVVLKNEK